MILCCSNLLDVFCFGTFCRMLTHHETRTPIITLRDYNCYTMFLSYLLYILFPPLPMSSAVALGGCKALRCKLGRICETDERGQAICLCAGPDHCLGHAPAQRPGHTPAKHLGHAPAKHQGHASV